MGERVSIIEKAAGRLGKGKDDGTAPVPPAAAHATPQSAYSLGDETLLAREQAAALHVDAILSHPEDSATATSHGMARPTAQVPQTLAPVADPDLRQHTVKRVEIIWNGWLRTTW